MVDQRHAGEVHVRERDLLIETVLLRQRQAAFQFRQRTFLVLERELDRAADVQRVRQRFGFGHLFGQGQRAGPTAAHPRRARTVSTAAMSAQAHASSRPGGSCSSSSTACCA